jgi:hypothetical protein
VEEGRSRSPNAKGLREVGRGGGGEHVVKAIDEGAELEEGCELCITHEALRMPLVTFYLYLVVLHAVHLRLPLPVKALISAENLLASASLPPGVSALA